MDFLAVDFFAVLFLAGDFFAVLFLAGDFFAVDFLAGDFLAVVVFFVVLFLAGDFFAAVFLAPVVFFAVVFLAPVDFFAAVFFAPLDFLAVDFLAVDFLAVDFLAGDFVAADLAAEAAFLAVAVAFLAPGTEAATVSFGSFLAPEMTFFRSAPGVNFGTAFFLDLMLWPVCGLRTVRAFRTRFSNEPEPVIATFSPFATSRVIVSRTDSSAWAAALRFPSKRAASVSMSCDLFTSFPSNEPSQPSPCSTFLQRTLGFCGVGHNQKRRNSRGFLRVMHRLPFPRIRLALEQQTLRSHP